MKGWLSIKPPPFLKVLRIHAATLYTEDERKVKKMSEDKAKEIIAESVAKEVVESIGEDLAGALVEYANLVKERAADLTYEQLKDLTYIKSLLGGQLPNWDNEDWDDLLENVRRKKQRDAETKREKNKKYASICARAKAMGIMKGDVVGALMDMESADKKFNLRLDDFLKADNFNFAHDFIGIQNNIVREHFPATDFGYFVPRFAGK